MYLAIRGGLNDGWPAEWSVHELVRGLEQRSRVLEITQSGMSRVDDQLQVELLPSGNYLCRCRKATAQARHVPGMHRLAQRNRRQRRIASRRNRLPHDELVDTVFEAVTARTRIVRMVLKVSEVG